MTGIAEAITTISVVSSISWLCFSLTLSVVMAAISVTQSVSTIANVTSITKAITTISVVSKISWLGFSFTFSIEMMSQAKAISVSMGNTSNHSNIMSTSRGNGMSNRETSSNLTYGIRFSFTFSIVMMAIAQSITSIAKMTSISKTVSVSKTISSIQKSGLSLSFTLSVEVMTIANSSDDSNIVGMTSGISIVYWKTSSNLIRSVRCCLSF